MTFKLVTLSSGSIPCAKSSIIGSRMIKNYTNKKIYNLGWGGMGRARIKFERIPNPTRVNA